MLQKLKNKLRLLKEKWVKIKGSTRYWIIVSIVVILIAGFHIPSFYAINDSLIKEENYLAMETMVETMMTEKTTDVDFDTSKVKDYTVAHKENSNKEITIVGDGLERIELILTSDYKIKSLERTGGIGTQILFWIVYTCFFIVIGCIATGVLFGICTLIKKIVKFFKV